MNSLLSRLYREQNGQALYLVAASLIAILGMAALSIDIGFALHAQRELQANTDAAASAGGAAMPNPATSLVATVVNDYSGSTAEGALYNVHSDLNVTSVSISFACVETSAYPGYKLPACATAPNSDSPSYPQCAYDATYNPNYGCNAIMVVETAKEPTFFGKIFGFQNLYLTATAVAGASGGGAIPYHIMVVLDTTNSMQTTNDTGCISSALGTTYTAEQCAQLGVQTLLSQLSPCSPLLASCGSNPAVDDVGLMAFPGICSDTASGVTTDNCPTLPATAPLTNTTANSTYAPDDYSCPASNPPITSYNNNPEYLVLGFQDNYRTSDYSALNDSSDIAQAVGAGTWINNGSSNSCGMPAPGGVETFYAGVLIAAEQYLLLNHTSQVQDVIIFLSDGDANSTHLGGNVQQTVTVGGMNGYLFSESDQCTQAANAAAWAKGEGAQIYSVSYNSGSSGCTTGDVAPYNSPCATMQAISSLPLSQYFYSVPNHSSGGSTICAGAAPLQYLDQVFTDIVSKLETARLIPVNVTATWTSPTG